MDSFTACSPASATVPLFRPFVSLFLFRFVTWYSCLFLFWWHWDGVTRSIGPRACHFYLQQLSRDSNALYTFSSSQCAALPFLLLHPLTCSVFYQLHIYDSNSYSTIDLQGNPYEFNSHPRGAPRAPCTTRRAQNFGLNPSGPFAPCFPLRATPGFIVSMPT